jgi:hypothetical protein
LLALSCHLAAVALGLFLFFVQYTAGDMDAAGLVLMGLVVYALTLRLNPLPRLVQMRLIRQATCGECGCIIDLVDSWRCGCGFTTWRPRHVFSPCPHCGKVFRWLACPGCQASIPI